MVIPNQLHKSFCTLWFHILNFSLPHFVFFAFSLFIGSSLICVDLKTLSLDINFPLVFHCGTSKLEASSSNSFVVFHNCTLKHVVPALLWSFIIIHCRKQHKPNVVGVRPKCAILWIWECSVVVDLTVGRVLAMWAEHWTCLECGI